MRSSRRKTRRTAWTPPTSGRTPLPINTEAAGSLHIRHKAAANSTVFFVCRPRTGEETESNDVYWEDVEPEVARAVRERIPHFKEANIRGVDLYLASFGPALEEFSRHWPLRRGTPRRQTRAQKRRRPSEVFEDKDDPCARRRRTCCNGRPTWARRSASPSSSKLWQGEESA